SPDLAPTPIYPLSLHDALPISLLPARQEHGVKFEPLGAVQGHQIDHVAGAVGGVVHDQADMFEKPAKVLELGHRDDQLLEVFQRSEEHTSELQSRENLVCRLLL